MRECERYRLVENRRATGRDIDEDALDAASAWRETADPDNVAVIDFYGANLLGQFAGMGKALSLDAVRAALDIHSIPREEWPDMTRRLLQVHAIYVEHLPEK